MADYNLIGGDLMDLDLNLEPVDPSVGSVERFGFLLNELESAHGRIEDRIRQLEAVTARARERQRWRQPRTSSETNRFSAQLMADLDGGRGSIVHANGNLGNLERTIGRRESCKRDSSHLVAMALERNLEVKKVDKEGGSFYDCNICLDLATEPVLTCCGHLFCWACFYQVSYIDSTCKECPVCKGEVSDSTVNPIYGNGGSERTSVSESGVKIPPRPKAHRVESARQHLSSGMSHLPVPEGHIRIRLGSVGDQTQHSGTAIVLASEFEPQELQNEDTAGGRRERIQQVSRVLSESAASLSSLSSALSNAERLVEDLETVINNRFLRSNARALSVDVGGSLARNSAVLQTADQPPDSTGETNPTLHDTPSPVEDEVAGSVLHSMLLRSSTRELASGSSSRRRSIMERIYDNNSRDSRESRRRRLN